MANKQDKQQFKKVFRGYDPVEVDRYIAANAEQEANTRRAQRERIEELLEENYNIRDRLAELQRAQNDVADALIAAQAAARDIEQNAKDYADKALIEAKKFYATWQAYSKTIVASFTEDELAAFSALEQKIGEVISGYEKKLKCGSAASAEAKSDVRADDEATAGEQTDNDVAAAQPALKPTPKNSAKRSMSAADFVKTIERAAEDINTEAEQSAQKSSKSAKNPIARVEQAAGQSIDLREILRPEESLEDICASLGLIDTDDEN